LGITGKSDGTNSLPAAGVDQLRPDIEHRGGTRGAGKQKFV
jgi:hypothetical protein